MHFQIAVTFDGRFSLSSVQRAQRLEGEKKERKKGSLVRYKSDDNYVGRPNKLVTHKY